MSNAPTSIGKRNLFSEDDIRIETKNGTETLIYDPYNPVNRMITKTEIETLLQNYGINVPINHFELYKRAFIHRSYTKSPLLPVISGSVEISDDESSTENVADGQRNEVLQQLTAKVISSPDQFGQRASVPCSPLPNSDIQIMPKPSNCLPLFTKSNERQEFIGDGVLECITKLYLYRRFPKENEGFMTEKKIALVKNEAIGRIAYEMGLHKWFILSKNTEEKQTRTNLKKLGCLFESFLGAIFLDFNKIQVNDEDGWFNNVFLTGPGFQIAQIFVENVFEKHVNWIELIRNDDNYKNILQVKIQKAFKVTPDYLEVMPYSNEIGYHMGVYLCLGQSIHGLHHGCSIPIQQFGQGASSLQQLTSKKFGEDESSDALASQWAVEDRRDVDNKVNTSIQEIHNHMSIHGKVLVFLGEGKHKIKKKAEQVACENAVRALQ